MVVSALIPTFNRRGYVQRAIESVLAQTAPVEEIIVVDDGSTDGTADAIARRYGSRISVVRQMNSGVSGARHRAIAEASGEWIAFLDSDDEWTPNRNQDFRSAAARVSADVGWLFGDSLLVADHGPIRTVFETHGLAVREDLVTFVDTWSIHHPFQFGLLESSFISRRALAPTGLFS